MKAEYKRRIAKAAEKTVDVPEVPEFVLLWVEAKDAKPTGRYWEQHGFDGEKVEKWDYFERQAGPGEVHFDDVLMDV